MASVGGGRIGYASRRRDKGEKGGEKEKGNEGGQRPQSQIKALSLPSASAFEAPARIERRLTLQLSLSVIVQKESTSGKERERETDRVRERETDGQTDGGKAGQCHRLRGARLS